MFEREKPHYCIQLKYEILQISKELANNAYQKIGFKKWRLGSDDARFQKGTSFDTSGGCVYVEQIE